MPPELPPLPQRKLLEPIFGDRILPRNAHAGLVYDRYLRIWKGRDLVKEKRSKEKREALDAFVQENNQILDAPDSHNLRLLKSLHNRLKRWPGIKATLRLTTASRFTVGLGASHPLENGFGFDATVGVPWLTGSSVKGLCRAWARLVLDENDPKFLQVFGSSEDGDERHAGEVIFLPAYPERWPKLEVDIINPHHFVYNASPRNRRGWAVDWENPVPVYFLTVAEGESFVFRLAARPQASVDVDEIREWIGDGLKYLGIGGKTALGYGVWQLET